ncbi:LysE family translocator [Mesorhizobium sp. M0751]
MFLAVKYAGAAYLVYLGVKALQEALRPPQQHEAAFTTANAFRQGLTSDLGNPKMAVFFASLLPQFVPPGGETFTALLGLGAVFAVMTFAWLTLYATVVAKAGDFLRRPSIRRVIEGVTGMVLIGLGIRIATEHR